MSQELPNPIVPVAAPTDPAHDAQPLEQPPLPVTPGPVKPTPRVSNRALNVMLGGALVLAVAGIAFAAGRLTAPAPTLTGGSFPGGNFPGGGPFGGQVQVGGGQGGLNGNGQGGIITSGAGPSIEGTVESVTETTLTIKTADGQTIQVALTGDTSYHAQTDASASDVVTGSRVLVRLDFRRGGGPTGPSATAGTGGGFDMTADDVTVVP